MAVVVEQNQAGRIRFPCRCSFYAWRSHSDLSCEIFNGLFHAFGLKKDSLDLTGNLDRRVVTSGKYLLRGGLDI